MRNRKKFLERISGRILWLLLGITLILFPLHYAILPDLNGLDNPAQYTPLLTDVLIAFTAFVFIAAVILTVVASMRNALLRRHYSHTVEHKRLRVLRIVIAACLIVMLAGCFLLLPAKPVSINGTVYENSFFIRASNMFITSILFLLLSTIAVTLCCHIAQQKNHNRTV